jgi:hypothetical protein
MRSCPITLPCAREAGIDLCFGGHVNPAEQAADLACQLLAQFGV